MRKKRLLLLPLLAAPAWIWAQNPTQADSLALADEQDAEAFVVSDFDVDEEGMSSQTTSSMASYNEDLFLTKTNFRFGHSYYNPRHYEQGYRTTFVNGAPINDVELGGFRFSSVFGGLSHVTRNQQGITLYEENSLNYADIGGSSNLNLRASQFGAGNRATLSLTNRNYIGRLQFTHASGLKNGWAWVISAGGRYGEEGNAKGTYLKSAALFLAVERQFNLHHSLSLSLMAAPTEQATASWTTEEAYWLANSHYYNPYWGYQNGKKRSSRVRKTFEPTAFLTWDWNIDDRTKLTTTTIFRYAKYGQTYINRTNNAADPRPDYYHYMPSSVFKVYKDVPDEWQLYEWQNYVDFWRASEENRQINWDKMYMINHNSVAEGGEAVYYLEEGHNDQLAWNFASTFNKRFSQQYKMDLGLNLNHTTGKHYKTMNDLLGANYHTDTDRFASSDFGAYSPEAQNDLDNPNRRIFQGDKFGYNYNIYVNKAQLWTTHAYNKDKFSLVLSGNISGTTIQREGLMRNGRSPLHSKGHSETAKFLSGGAKYQLGYKFDAHSQLNFGGGFEYRPPLANRAFIDPQIKNDFVNGLENEFIFHLDANYKFSFGRLDGMLKAYYTQFTDQVEQTQFFDDIKQKYSYLTMTNVEKLHYGVELALQYNFTSNFSLDFVGAIGDAKYRNNADAFITYDNADEVQFWDEVHDTPLKVITDGMRVGCTPLTALSFGAKYNISGWFFEARLNYYDRSYIYFSPYLRLSDVIPDVSPTFIEKVGEGWSFTSEDLAYSGVALLNKADADGNVTVNRYIPKKQEKFKSAWMLDLSIGKFIRFHGGKSLSINLNLTNVTNNQNMVLRGREENRNDNTDKTGKTKQYDFGRNPKYMYAYPFNAFLNLNYRF